ncbi:hypothetical protein BH23PAT1_BH23PAT1_1790 [soil metagenome]
MVIYKGDPNTNELALIFDDGPNPLVTPKLLEVLKEKGVKANFFIIGARAEQYPDVLKQIVQDGHEIGDHSYTHQHMSDVLRQEGENIIREEIEKSRSAIIKISGLNDDNVRFFRPPFLDWNEELSEIAQDLYGDRIIMTPLAVSDWDWGSDDWDRGQTDAIRQKADEIVKVWEKETKPGAIYAFHDSSHYNLPGNKTKDNWPHRAWPTLESIPKIIEFLETKGLKIKKLSEMTLVSEDQLL